MSPTTATRPGQGSAPATDPDHTRWLELLTGPAAADVLAAALGADGARLGTWRVDQVHARPGAEVTVGFDVVAHRDAAPLAEGAPRSVEAVEYLLATTADLPAGSLGAGVVRLADEDRVLHVWRHPADPLLPGLAEACDADALTRRLRASGHPVDVVSVEVVAYRPLRRAVLRARTTRGVVYVKVVRPDRVRSVVRRHVLLGGGDRPPGAVRGPRCLTWSADGVVVLEEAHGRSLAQHLAATPVASRATAFDPRALLRALDELPPAATALTRRAAWAARVHRYARTAVEVHGLDAARADAVAQAVAAVDEHALGPVVATHGDFHAANVLLADAAGDRVGVLLDLDTLGPGHRVDDLACVVAHLAVLPSLSPGDYAGSEGLVERCLAEFDRAVDPAVLRARTAGVVLSLASGAVDAALARTWLAIAEGLVADAVRAGHRVP
ncbi:phosphotransferase [Cellulosimicrobium marinum]|uniref:phosphotransferase n=1 Tax=Cellulosimicrobium marinum TaxID=1638992 RepID=UPI001E40A0C9|nr:phosphotransferase [Cellulosimicrobium marinum]MCB7136807.1 aminoglycoside phosphotransferase family protein [Cellulosimicrobium marinum]